MKAITKAKRRVTLSICGLGFLDKTEVSDIPSQVKEAVHVDHETGEIEEDEDEAREAKEQEPDYEDRLQTISEWLDTRSTEQLGQALQHVQQKTSDWPEEWQNDVRAVTLPYAAADLVRKNGPQAREQLEGWIEEQVNEHGLSGDVEEQALIALNNAADEIDSRVPEEGSGSDEEGDGPSTDAADAMMDGETALDDEGGDGPDGDEGAQEREHESAERALQAICPAAIKAGKLAVVPEEERISEKQLKRLFAIADEEGWKESWVDRLIKDELGFESKSHLASGKCYDQIIQALESDEMRYHMSRDPDTPDLFEEE
jgi:hypothetical protein